MFIYSLNIHQKKYISCKKNSATKRTWPYSCQRKKKESPTIFMNSKAENFFIYIHVTLK